VVALNLGCRFEMFLSGVFLNKGTKTLTDYQPLSLMPVSPSDLFFEPIVQISLGGFITLGNELLSGVVC